MKTRTTIFKLQRKWAATFVVAAIVGSGCSQAPEGPTAADAQKLSQQQFDKQIETVKNNPQMSADAKQKAIAMINSQKAASSKTAP